MDVVRLSVEAVGRLQVELEQLRGPRRAEMREAVLQARQMGSIVENGDYTAAKEEERLLEDRIAHLEDLLGRAVPVEGAPVGVVAAGAVVTVRFDGDSGEEVYLFGETAERSEQEVCTPSSPMGDAISGCRAGDVVRYRTPAGRETTVEIVSVL